MLLFVYGTLKSGYGNNRILSNSKLVGTAIVRDHELFNSGFPVSNKAEGTCITGEVWDIGDPDESQMARNTLWNLDGLEGYHPDNLPRSMYHRVETIAFGDDGETYQVNMYLGNSKYWSDFQGMRKCPYDENTKAYTWNR